MTQSIELPHSNFAEMRWAPKTELFDKMQNPRGTPLRRASHVVEATRIQRLIQAKATLAAAPGDQTTCLRNGRGLQGDSLSKNLV